MARQGTIDRLLAWFPAAEPSEFRGESRVVMPRESLGAALGRLKEELGFDMLVDVTCVDYLAYRGARQRFGLVYLLLNTESGERLTLRAFVDDPDPTVPSATGLWEG
ncbi:MAG: NADH-quinone oxidoreductase subunit C, partial [Thermoguttaceae bacterium]